MLLKALGSLQVDLPPDVCLRGTKRRTLLAALLAHTPHVVPTDTLVEMLWSRTPASAAANLRTYVTDLRRMLATHGAEATIVHTELGYGLLVPADEVDFLVFEREVREGLRQLRDGAPARAERVLDGALALWRGAPFAEVNLGPYQPARVRALEELRWEALAASADALMRLGRHAEAVSLLRGTVEERPHCERSRAQLMLGLHELGRRAEALEIFNDGRRLLRDDLGIDADQELQSALTQVLSGHAHERTPRVEVGERSGPCTLMARHPGFVSDAKTLEDLTSWVGGPRSRTRPRVLSLVGPVGSGKTALATELAHRVAARYPHGRLFMPLVEDGRPRDVAGVISELLVLLGQDRHALPTATTDLAAQLRASFACRHVLVVLDGADSPEQARYLLPGDGPSSVVLTSRHSMRAIDGVREEAVQAIGIDLGTQLLGSVLGPERLAEDPVAVRRIVDFCDGLPLALRIAAERLRTRPSLPLSVLADRLAGACRLDELDALDLSVRSAITTAYRQLDRPVQHLLTALLASPSGMTLRQVSALCDWPESRSRSLIERLLAEGLLVEQPGHDGTERFRLLALWAATLEDLVAEGPPLDKGRLTPVPSAVESGAA